VDEEGENRHPRLLSLSPCCSGHPRCSPPAGRRVRRHPTGVARPRGRRM